MTENRDEHSYGLLADQRLGRTGLEVKVDRGFAEGRYGVYLHFDDAAANIGFTAARRKASEYFALLKKQLDRLPGYRLGETVDESAVGGPGRKRDLEATYLFFPVETADGRYHDHALREHFRLASLRAGQAWDQTEARSETQRRDRRQEEFRHRLAGLLEGQAYAEVNAGTKERLLHDVPALAFAPKGRGR
jgi:hypothetical protein